MSRRRNRGLTAAARAGRIKVHAYHHDYYDEPEPPRRRRIQPHPWDDHPEPEEIHWREVAWWYDPIPGHEPWTWSEWQDAWGELTASVTWAVWRKQGSKLYATHRDSELREDLQSWLAVEAQEIAARFIPNPDHPAPEKNWAAYLTTALTRKARYHFTNVVGDGRYPAGRAAWDVHKVGIIQSSVLEDIEAETGRVVSRHALHGHPFGTEDPASVIIRLEDLVRQVANIERDQLGTHQVTSEVCLINHCERPVWVKSRGLCDSHYNAERRDAVERGDWDPRTPIEDCQVDGCDEPHHARGRCRTHYIQLRATEVARCGETDCDKPVHAKGMCAVHYNKWRRHQPAPPCSIEGCEKKSANRGLCHMHYQHLRKRERAAEQEGTPLEQEGTPLEKEGPPSQEEPPTEATT